MTITMIIHTVSHNVLFAHTRTYIQLHTQRVHSHFYAGCAEAKVQSHYIYIVTWVHDKHTHTHTHTMTHTQMFGFAHMHTTTCTHKGLIKQLRARFIESIEL